MKKFVMMLLSILLFTSFAWGIDIDCSDEVLFRFFPKEFVIEVLAKTDISDDNIQLIAEELGKKDQEIIELIEKKASKVQPNPLLDEKRREKAIDLFRETLLEVYAKVMRKHGVKDETEIEETLESIQEERAIRFEACMKAREEFENGG